MSGYTCMICKREYKKSEPKYITNKINPRTGVVTRVIYTCSARCLQKAAQEEESMERLKKLSTSTIKKRKDEKRQ